MELIWQGLVDALGLLARGVERGPRRRAVLLRGALLGGGRTPVAPR